MGNRLNSNLDELRMIILQMAALAENALEKSTRALLERNDDLAREVLKEDREIDLLEVEVDRYSLRLLALGQPMARDLRFIIGGLRIAVELERIGDQAANIARRALALKQPPPSATQQRHGGTGRYRPRHAADRNIFLCEPGYGYRHRRVQNGRRWPTN